MSNHPRTRKKIEEHNLNRKFILCDPVTYFEMLYLLKHCSLVMTDSGGLQKEAYFFGKQCLILREETESPELVKEGNNFLYHQFKLLTQSVVDLANTKRATANKNLYGSGNSGDIIVNYLKSAMQR